MRIGIVLLGVILLIVGGALAMVPVAASSQAVGENGGTTTWVVQSNALLLNQYFTGSWSSASAVDFFAIDCGTNQPNVQNLNGPCPNPVYLTSPGPVNGTSGSLNFNVPGGHWLLFSASGPTTVNLKASYGTLGPALLIVGALILIVGLALKRSSKMKPAPAPASPTA